MSLPLAQIKLSHSPPPRRPRLPVVRSLEGEISPLISRPHRVRLPPPVPVETQSGDDFELGMMMSRSESQKKDNWSEQELSILSSGPLEPDLTPEKFKRASEMATIFLDTRKVLRAECNIVDPLLAEAHAHGSHGAHKTPIVVLRQSHLRAEKVKLTIAVKYMYIQRQYDQRKEGHFNYPGVEGVYNPLQIIRNRRIRAKYHEYPGQLSIKTLPLACNAFSKHNLHGKRHWRMIWLLELNELLSDSGWRNQHWHELVNGKGELLFPEVKPPKESKRRKPLHDKLFDDFSSSEDERRHHHRLAKRSLSGNETEQVQFKRRYSRSPMRLRDKIRSKHRRSSQVVLLLDELEHLATSLPPNTNEDEEDGLVISVPHTVPMITVEDTNPVNDIHFKHASREQVAALELDLDELRCPVLLGISPQLSQEVSAESQIEIRQDNWDNALTSITNDFNYLELVIKLKLNYLLNVYPQYTERVNTKLSKLMSQDISDLLEVAVNINDNQLQMFERLFNAYYKEVQLVLQVAHDKHTLRIDQLLSGLDRGISEINTLLLLEARKVSERLDRLAGSLKSLCGVLFGAGMTLTPLAMPLEGGYRAIYFGLETVIVVTLRLIWIIVNIYKAIAFVIMAVLRLFWFILFK